MPGVRPDERDAAPVKVKQREGGQVRRMNQTVMKSRKVLRFYQTFNGCPEYFHRVTICWQ